MFPYPLNIITIVSSLYNMESIGVNRVSAKDLLNKIADQETAVFEIRPESVR